jgi:hypothetical protein
MGNPPRYVPGPCRVEVTTRTVHGRFLLRPSRDLNDLVIGILARAAERYDVGVVAFVALSNHLLCAAAHKKCYVERRIMWSWRMRSRSSGTRPRLSSA